VLNEVLAAEYKIIDAYDGKEGEKKFERNKDKISLVLLDMTMPDKTGLEVLNELKAFGVGDIPVVMLTSVSEHDVESACIDAGAIDYIMKPINVKAMKARLRAHIAYHENAGKSETERIVKDRVRVITSIVGETLAVMRGAESGFDPALVGAMSNLQEIAERVYGD
jgi:DNA-binding response OmpR family regulator